MEGAVNSVYGDIVNGNIVKESGELKARFRQKFVQYVGN